MPSSPKIATALCLLVATSQAGLVRRYNTNGPPKALPQLATDNDLRFQPAVDFDTDSCYNVAAIDANKHVSEGLDHNNVGAAEDCRDESDLTNSNVYSRQRCNNGWCAYLYDYYFEKDVAVQNVADAGGHVHDWEHVVVWAKEGSNTADYVAVSGHGGYDWYPRSDVRWDGTHPKVVYHKDGGSTHRFRIANAGDEPPENAKHVWWRSALVSYNGFPAGVRQALYNADFGHATMGSKDSTFASDLAKAIPIVDSEPECSVNPATGTTTCASRPMTKFPFEYTLDADGSPGTPASTTPQPPPPSNMKIMIVGDSITHGADGDYTWRYRIWQWFRDSTSLKIDFVGPYVGTNTAARPMAPQPPRLPEDPPPSTGPKTNGRYALDVSTAFDSAHFAVWGRQVNQDKSLIQDMVSTYQPDMLLVALGFNDMGWFVSGPEGTLTSMKTFVDNARAANPNIKMAIANVPQRSHIGGRDDLAPNTSKYNSLLRDAIPNWSTSTSPIKLVEFAENYSCQPDSCPAGYDGLHPDALGEFQIAHAFSLTLHNGFGIGRNTFDVPAPTFRLEPCPYRRTSSL